MTIFQIAALVLIMANLYLIFKVRTEKRFYISLMWALSMILLGIHCYFRGPQILTVLFFVCAVLEMAFEILTGRDDDDAGPCC